MAAIEPAAGEHVSPVPVPATGGRTPDDASLLDVLDQSQPGAEARFDALRELGQRASDSSGAFQGGLDALRAWHEFDMGRQRDLLELRSEMRLERQEAALGWIRVAAAAVSLGASIALVTLAIGGNADPIRVGSLFTVALGGSAPALLWLWRSSRTADEQQDPPASRD